MESVIATYFAIGTTFFVMKNETGASKSPNGQYRLSRLFDFTNASKLYTLPDDLTLSCALLPAAYSAGQVAEAQ